MDNGHDFNFITNPNTNSYNMKSSGYDDRGARIKKVAILGTTFLLVVILLLIFFSSLGTNNTSLYTNSVKLQSEIIAISELAITEGQSLEVKNQASRTLLLIQSDRQQIIDQASKSDIEIDLKKLEKSLDPELLSELNDATTVSRFDSVFADTLETKLAQYKVSLDALSQAELKQRELDIVLLAQNNLAGI